MDDSVEAALATYCEMTGARPEDVEARIVGDEIKFVRKGEAVALPEFEDAPESDGIRFADRRVGVGGYFGPERRGR